jgi:hypothetical protein
MLTMGTVTRLVVKGLFTKPSVEEKRKRRRRRYGILAVGLAAHPFPRRSGCRALGLNG